MNEASKNTPEIRSLQPEDIRFGEQLCEIAGWNQVTDDWTRLLDYEPRGCFVGWLNDRPVGTVTTTSYGQKLAWIGMMLVHPDARRQGVGTELMRTALNYLAKRDVAVVKLDATPLGYPVYQRLGFVDEWPFHRWRREGKGNPRRRVGAADPAGSGAILRMKDFELDLDAFGVNRGAMLESLATESAVVTHTAGFGMLRPGRTAAHLGPVIAQDPQDAQAIIDELLSLTDAPVIWDVPGPNADAADLAESLGFQPMRELTRMVKANADVEIHDRPELQFAIACLAAG